MKDFKHKMIITDVLRMPHTISIRGKRFIEVEEWVNESFGPLNCKIAFEEWYVLQSTSSVKQGEWLLYVNNEEDIVAFKLRWGV